MPADYSKWKAQLHTAKNALSARPPRQYIVSNLMFIPSLSMVYGFSGSLKTNLVMDMAICVALGKPWLSGDKLSGYGTTQSPVLWVDADSGMDTLDERFEAMLRAHGGNKSTPIHYISFADPPFTALNEKSKLYMIEMIRDLKAHLVCFDNLGTTSGARDENSSEMSAVMSAIRFIAIKSGAAAMVIHHNPKAEQERKSPRGHSSIEASLDLGLYCARDGEVLTITPTKTRQAPIPVFSCLWQWSHKPKSTELYRAKLVGIEVELDEKTLKARHAILTEFNQNGRRANQTQLVTACEKVKIGRNKALSEIQYLAGQEIILPEPERGAHNQIFYRLSLSSTS